MTEIAVATAQEAVLAELVEIRDRLAANVVSDAADRDRRLELFREGQALDPKITQAALAEAAGISEPAVTQTLRKARAKEEAAAGG